MAVLDPAMVGSDILACAVHVLEDLPDSEATELLAFAQNSSSPEAAMIELAIETFESELEMSLGNLCPGVKWSCTLVAISIDLRGPFGIQSMTIIPVGHKKIDNNHCWFSECIQSPCFIWSARFMSVQEQEVLHAVLGDFAANICFLYRGGPVS